MNVPPLLTVFANFRIDSGERLLRMQDSFRSFRAARIDEWVINIRGPLKDQAAEFLRAELAGELTLTTVESGQGWFHDTRQMLPNIRSEYVFFWIEDHLCIGGSDYFDQVVAAMRDSGAEYLLYTGFHAGATLQSLDCLPTEDVGPVLILDYDRACHRKRLQFIRRQNIISPTFVISNPSLLKRTLFERVLLAKDPLIRRWPKETPFDFEKTNEDMHWLPIRVAHPKREFFAFIDDDHGRPGHSLVSRGLYPDRVSRDEMLAIREADFRTFGKGLRRSAFNRIAPLVNQLHSLVRRIPGLRFSLFV